MRPPFFVREQETACGAIPHAAFHEVVLAFPDQQEG